jgi:tetratricopeptide (TPR) repeat protein
LIAVTMAGLAACAAPHGSLSGPMAPGQRIVVTNRETGKRIETTYGKLTAIAAAVELRRRNYGRAIAISTGALNSRSLTETERSLNFTVRGIAFLAINRRTAARTDFDSAIAHDAGNYVAWAQRGALNTAEHLYAEAAADFDRSLALRPTATVYCERGALNLARRRLLAARADFGRAIDLKPDFALAYLGRGLTYHATGATALARADYRRAIDLDPGLPGVQQALDLLNRRAPAPRLQQRKQAPDVIEF